MKTVYFARHGQTEGNVKELVQGADDPLNDVGKKQAEQLAERCKKLDFEKLISSDFSRAQETAREISKVTGKEVFTSELFREVMRPQDLVGTPRAGEAFQSYLVDERENSNNKNFDTRGGEHFPKIAERVADAVEYIESQPEDKLFVVSHGHFLRALITYILHGKSITFENYSTVGNAMRMYNTGITVIKEYEDGLWILVTWNDIAHFADK